jgi:hypothetical protein
VIVEDSTFSVEEADAFSRQVERLLAYSGKWNSLIRMRMEPLPPYESRVRPLPLEGSKPIPWLLEREPRLACILAVRGHDPNAHFRKPEKRQKEVLRTILRQAKSEMQTLLNERLIYGHTVVEGQVDHEDQLVCGNDERNLELRFAITLLEV